MEPRQNPNVQVDPFSRRWQRLVDRALDGAVVPFLGSGISLGSSNPSEPDVTPALWWMKERLTRLLVERVLELISRGQWADVRAVVGALGLHKPNLPLWPGAGPELECVDPHTVQVELNKRCNGDSIAFDRLAEVVRALRGSIEPVRAIRVDALDGLLPLASHRMLARLAREGLVTEIITTNWDAAIEDAWLDSFGERPPPWGSDDQPEALATILDLEDYRRHGSRMADDERRPVLHLYKINGCARRWKRVLSSSCGRPSRLETEANRVILTESQLHDFRKEDWARELLRDRTRRSALVFSGFGSDEAQIRYTVVALMEEFTRRAREDSEPARRRSNVWEEDNAVFVQAFDPALSYSQVQMLWAFWASTGEARPPLASWDLADVNQFNAQDLDGFAPGCSTSRAGLSADLFWTRLYQAVIGRLAVRRLTTDGWTRWLREAGLPPGAVCDQLLRWLYPPADPVRWRFGRLYRIWDEDPGSEAPAALRVMRWLANMQGLEDLTPQVQVGEARRRDWYQPLCERDLLVGLLLALHGIWRSWAARADLDQWLDEIRPTRLGLRVPVPGARDGELAAVWLVAEEYAPPSRLDSPDDLQVNGQVRVIVVPSLRAGPDPRAVCLEGPGDVVRRLSVRRIATAALEDVLPDLIRPSAAEGSRPPALAFARAQRSSRRARLRELPQEV